MNTVTPSPAAANIAAVSGTFEAFGRGDLTTFAEGFHPDATWNHRNPDRLGGIHAGRDAIVAFIAESGTLTAGTLRAAPEVVMADDDDHVAVAVHLTAERPDGRRLDDRQMLFFTLENGLIGTVDQYIGAPEAVTAFWD